jgi:hypothetical protein
MLSDRLKLVFATTELQFMSIAQVQKAVYWKDQTTEQLRTRIGQKLEEEVSTLGSLDILRKITFNSKFGLIDSVAFAVFQRNFKKEVMRIQAGGSFSVNKIHLKDIIIEALPDLSFQRELYATFGGTGCLLMEANDFAINLVFAKIEARITSVTKQGLRAVVNKSTREREAHFLTTPTHGKATAVRNLDIEEIVEEQVNAAMAGEKKCKKTGIGKDGLLFCRWLGEKGTCCFDHPSSELALKGKGVSKEAPGPDWLNNGKKAFQLSGQLQDPFYDEFQTGNGGGAADHLSDE